MFGIKYDIQHMYEYGCFVPLYTGTIEEIKRDSREHFETDQKKMCETEYDYGYYFEYDENAWNEFIDKKYYSPIPEQHLFLVELDIKLKHKNNMILTEPPYIITTRYAIIRFEIIEHAKINIHLFSNRKKCIKFFNTMVHTEYSDTSMIDFLAKESFEIMDQISL